MDSSFSSTGSNSALHQDARRVNRFMSRNNNKEKCKSNPSTIGVLSLGSLSSCTSSDSLQNVSFKREYKTYVIEGIHGPVTTDKAPIGAVSNKRDHKRSRQRFKQYVAARQNERAKKLSPNSMGASNRDEYDQMYARQNESPTTITADISRIRDTSNADELDNAFIYTKSPLKSNFNKNIGMIPKKKLSWWDDEENRNKPFLLRSDDLWDDDSCESARRRTAPFGDSGCPHDNLADLIEDYSDRLRSTVADLFQVKRIGDSSMFRENFASFSEDMNEDYEEDRDGGCAGPSMQLFKVVKNILPPVCDFETYDGDVSIWG